MNIRSCLSYVDRSICHHQVFVAKKIIMTSLLYCVAVLHMCFSSLVPRLILSEKLYIWPLKTTISEWILSFYIVSIVKVEIYIINIKRRNCKGKLLHCWTWHSIVVTQRIFSLNLTYIVIFCDQTLHTFCESHTVVDKASRETISWS